MATAIIEQGEVAQLFAHPREEYTRDLLSAIPNPVPRQLRV
jgi:oligopeptide transport system ATP-binding protein